MRVDLPTEYLFELRAEVAAPLVIGPSSHGFRRVIPITGGSFHGPRLSGRVVPGGADLQFVRPDGVFELEARYTLEADDGTLIQVVNHALRHGPPEVIERVLRGEAVPKDAYYFRTVADFEAPLGPHDWLNKAIIVGHAEREAVAAIVRFYLVL